MDFEKICMLFTMQEPYYGIILSSMERIATNKIDTLCVSRSGNVFRLIYNPAFVGRFDVNTTLELIKHEILHIAFNHFTIWDGAEKTDTEDMHTLRNIACDLEINCYLDRNKMSPQVGGVWCEDYGFNKYEGSRQYLNLLLNKAQQMQQQQAQSPSDPCNGGQGGQQQQQPQQNQQQPNQSDSSQQARGVSVQAQPSGSGQGNQGQQSQMDSNSSGADPSIPKEMLDSFDTFDDHSQWPDCNEAEAEQLKDAIEDMLVFAAEETEKNCGQIPGELSGKIKMIRERKRPKPVADWKRYFRRYLGNEFTEFIRKSKKRESRRFPDAAGNRHRRKSNIIVAIDTSGSVSMPEYREFFGQIKTLSALANFHVIECDATIQYEYDFKGKESDTLHGGGGTNFGPVIDYYIKNKKKYDSLVYFTDGYASIPKNTPKDTLWVISSNGDHDRTKYKVNGASVAFIPSK